MSDIKLTLADISEPRAYERERNEFRARIIELKKRRRVSVGPVVTVVFENRDTIRFQIQEMARAERMLFDEQIQTELDIYNPLIPEPGELSATMFLELTDKDEMVRWLPALVGIEGSAELVIGAGPANGFGPASGVAPVNGSAPSPVVVPCEVDPQHAAQLTREETTASVHYVHFRLAPDEVERFGRGPVTLTINHPKYRYSTALSEVTRSELLGDLLGGLQSSGHGPPA
jgi:hypothetical protein